MMTLSLKIWVIVPKMKVVGCHGRVTGYHFPSDRFQAGAFFVNLAEYVQLRVSGCNFFNPWLVNLRTP